MTRCMNLCWKLPRACSIRGDRTHVSDPKSNTDWMTALEHKPNILGSAPSQTRILVILVIRVQLFQAFLKLPATAGKSLSPTIRICPRYMNKVNIYRGSQ